MQSGCKNAPGPRITSEKTSKPMIFCDKENPHVSLTRKFKTNDNPWKRTSVDLKTSDQDLLYYDNLWIRIPVTITTSDIGFPLLWQPETKDSCYLEKQWQRVPLLWQTETRTSATKTISISLIMTKVTKDVSSHDNQRQKLPSLTKNFRYSENLWPITYCKILWQKFTVP